MLLRDLWVIVVKMSSERGGGVLNNPAECVEWVGRTWWSTGRTQSLSEWVVERWPIAGAAAAAVAAATADADGGGVVGVGVGVSWDRPTKRPARI